MSFATTRDLAAAPAERRFDRSVAAVMLAGACTFINVYATQPLLPLLRREFHASEVQVSLTVSVTTLAIALAAPIVGLLAEATGRKRVIVPSIFGLAVPTLLAATSPHLHALIVWRFLQGLFVPGIIAVMMAYINEEWHGRGPGATMAAYIAGTVFGGFLGRFVSGLVSTHWPWRRAFLVIGVLDLLGGLAVWRWLPRSQNFTACSDWRVVVSSGLKHLRNPRLLGIFAIGFLVLFCLMGAFTYVNFYLAAPPFHLTPAELGSIFLVYLLGLIVTPLSGKFLDRNGFRRTMLLALTMSVAGLLLTLAHALWVIIVGLAVFSSGVFVSQAAATVETGVVAGSARSAAAGLYVTFYYVGGSVGATVMGWAWLAAAWPGCVALLVAAALTTVLFAYLCTD